MNLNTIIKWFVYKHDTTRAEGVIGGAQGGKRGTKRSVTQF